MNVKQIMAIALALCAVMGSFALIGADDSDAVSAGQTNVYIYDGSQWSDHTGMAGYNALQALQATGKTIVADTDYILEKENEWGPYTEMNSNYGNVTSIGGVAEDGSNVWNVFVYNNGWSVGIDAIGFITPFSDGAAPSANVVLYYGADAEAVPAAVSNHVTSYADLIDPVGNDAYAVEFLLRVDTNDELSIVEGTTVEYYDTDEEEWVVKILEASDLADGITIRGYGSNAYAALKDAIGAGNISATEAPGAYYGWMNSMFGLGTVSGANYVYWVQNGVDEGVVNYLSFNLGAYSTLDNVASDEGYDFTCGGFQLIYQEYIYS